MRIGIIGGGVVGQATARAFMEHVEEVRVYDTEPSRRTAYLADVNCKSDLVFICLPEGELDTFFANQVRVGQAELAMVIKSTVPIGTTHLLSNKYKLPNLVHSPEFLTARCANTDAQMPTRNIIGVLPGIGPISCPNTLRKLYETRWPHVPVYIMSSDESEAVKLMQNSFFAVKVAFWNECRALADKLGLRWQTIIDAILADGRISPSHTQVPGPDGKRGFGGGCLPKDLDQLIMCMIKNSLYADVCCGADRRNRLHDREAK